MLIGVMGDTHDRLPAITALLARMMEAGVGFVLHVGDYCSPFSLGPFVAANMALAGVFGHNDADHEGLRAAAGRAVGAELYEAPHSVDVGGVRILLLHDIAEAGGTSLQTHGIVVHGSSHREEMKTRGDTLIINPGEACGWLHGTPTAALVDIDTRAVEFITLHGPEWRT
jgi:hypothetical protein